MISQESIEKVIQSASVVEVVGDVVKLKKAGVNYSGNCPFHDEKTPSFTVSEAKGIFKCFGCGEAGNAVSFVMKYHRKTFPEAIEMLAEKYHITLERDSNYDAEAHKQKIEARDGIIQVNEFALEKFRSAMAQLPEEVSAYIQSRLTPDDIIEHQIGFAVGGGKILTTPIINSGRYEFGIKSGLISEKSGSAYDMFQNRVMFPIFNNEGRPVGFGGRIIGDGQPKYLNSPENPAYNKSQVLYGLDKANKAIQKEKLAYLVEGYTDVIALHRHGYINSVGTCGTALTPDQVKLLKRYCKHVVLLRDGDAAGSKAAARDTELLVAEGFKVDVVIFETGADPDSYLGLAVPEVKMPLPKSLDAIEWRVSQFFANVGDDAFLRSSAISSMVELLKKLKNELTRNQYLKNICKAYKLQEAEIKKMFITTKMVEDLSEEDEALSRLNKPQKEEYMRYGFFEQRDGAKTGYYFRNANGSSFTAKTNFVITPLYHVYGGDNRRMIIVTNGITPDEVIEMQSKDMLSMERFCAELYNQGYFLPREGFTRDHLLRIHNKIGNAYPRVYEITTLGWQPEGFFAFQNRVYKPGNGKEKGEIAEYNEYGIASVGDRLFLSPSLSKAQDGLREGENLYENDLYLQYKESKINFSQWSELMANVYGKNAWMGIAWCVATIMKDIMEKSARVPHLNPYGQKGSGKSEYGNSVQYLFFSGKDSFGDLYKPMNLNQGTDFAFFNRYERFSNCPNVLNEFDENAIKDEWFRAIKSSYDGEGREKGKGKNNQTTSQKIRSTTVIIGQYLGTKDDNSVLSRSLPLSFKLEDSRPDDQVMFFRKLKQHEEEGLSSLLCEIMDLRNEFSRSFGEIFFGHVKDMQQQLLSEGIQTIDRILKNVCMMVACIDIAGKHHTLPFSLDEFKAYGREFVKSLTKLITKTSKLAEFWKIVESLVDMNVLEEGFDFDIKTGAMQVKILDGRNDQMDQTFNEPTDLVFLRFSAVHSYYEKEFRSRTGQKATNDETIRLYLQEQKYFVGTQKSHKFYSQRLKKETNTSCIVLNMSKMDINLIRTHISNDLREEIANFTGFVLSDPTETNQDGVCRFSIRHTEKVEEQGKAPVYNDIIINCFMRNSTIASVLQRDDEVILSGKMSENGRSGKSFRTITVEKLECKGVEYSGIGGNLTPEIDDELPF
mgnify:CR=1 FL=1